MKVPVYLIVKSTGQFDADGAELTIILDVKLTRAAAEVMCSYYEDTKVRILKMVADKGVDV
jgi:hypothetical protein